MKRTGNSVILGTSNMDLHLFPENIGKRFQIARAVGGGRLSTKLLSTKDGRGRRTSVLAVIVRRRVFVAVRTSVSAVIGGLGFGCGRASASKVLEVSEASHGAGHLSTTAQVAIGTLPLLAALAFGIVVAVLSVVAFLQMTTKDRGRRGSAGHQSESGEADEFSAAFDDWKAAEEYSHSMDWTTAAAAADNGPEAASGEAKIKPAAVTWNEMKKEPVVATEDEMEKEFVVPVENGMEKEPVVATEDEMKIEPAMATGGDMEKGFASAPGDEVENEPAAVAGDFGGPSRFDDTARLTLPPTLLSDAACPDWETNGVPRVCGLEGTFAGTCFRLNGSGLSIGRDPAQCALVFPLSAGEVSRKHCTLRFDEDKRLFVLEDHDSSNGTFLQNGERLKSRRTYELRSGERFVLSGHHHWFEVRDGE